MGEHGSARAIPLLAHPIKATALVCEEQVVKDNMPATYPMESRVEAEGLMARLAAEGMEFEAAVYQRLAADLPPGTVRDLSSPTNDRSPAAQREREEATLRAVLDPQVLCILNPRLGRHFLTGWREATGTHLDDGASLWTSEPDVVLIDRSGPAPALRAVDIKHHRTRGTSGRTVPRRLAPLATPWLESAEPTMVVRPGTATLASDLLQLAHYVEHLRAWGLAPVDSFAAVIGSEADVVWIDLDVEKVQVIPAISRYREAQQRYRTLVAHARAVESRAEVERLTHPEHKDACTSCHWRDVCAEELAENYPGGHITLLAGITPRVATAYYPEGIEGVAQLAELPLGRGRDADIVRARSWLTGDVFSTPNTADPVCPSADVEFDFDIEWTSSRSRAETGESGELVYAWGCLETAAGLDSCESLVDWELAAQHLWDTDAAEAAVFAAFWARIQASRESAIASGQTWLAFHYTDPEPSRMRRLAAKHAGYPGVPTVSDAEDLLGSGAVVDLVDYVRSLIWPLPSNGLKDVAKHCGFTWRADDAGGDMSTVWRQGAVASADPAERLSFQRRLYDYNVDDVLAQRAVRRWIRANTEQVRPWPDR